MKIYKDAEPGYNSKAKVEAAIELAREDIRIRDEGDNQPFQAPSWAVDLVRSGVSYEYIDKTNAEVEQEKADQAQAEAEAELESEMLVAQTTPSGRYAEFRQMEYLAEGLTFDYWNELVIEEDTAGQADYKTRRDVIRAKYPKPVE